jgi:hypothetical protein
MSSRHWRAAAGALGAAGLLWMQGSGAQGLERRSEPYQAPALLPIAPAAATAPTPRPAPAAPSLALRKGVPLSEQLRVHASDTGWDLVWEAPVLVVDRDLQLPGAFEPALEALLRGVNESGTRLRATFYRGNRTVRVSEF